MSTPAIYPIILCGGAGSRLWPVSRESYPKQFLPLIGEQSLLQETLARVIGGAGFRPPVIVTSEDSRFLVARQLQEVDVSPTALILEPERRNTAPAAAVAAFYLSGIDPDALMLVMPADHYIHDAEGLQRAVAAGRVGAETGHLVTFGVTPRWPETGYGYIQRGAPAGAAFDVERFVEKPSRTVAESYIASGDYYWNAGIFLFRLSRYLEALRQYRPRIYEASRAAIEGARADLDFLRLERGAFLDCPAESIDYAVMESDPAVQVVPADIGWSDVGSWNAVWDIGAPDADGNVSHGDVLLEDCRRCYLRSEEKLTAAIGLQDIVVVETADAVLVSHRDRSQEVKTVVEKLRAQGRHEHLIHTRVYRPWGYYETLHLGKRHQVKLIHIDVGQRISLQLHRHRAEHWIVISGTAQVQRGDEEFALTANQSTYIPLGTKHRLSNLGEVPLLLIEVQSGTYLGEDDIVRFEDVYNRA